MKSSPIILVDDDQEDCEFVQLAMEELKIKNKLIIFHKSAEVLEYLKNMPVRPFFILCDVNMPMMSGLELKEKIDADKVLCERAVPFLFLSTSIQQNLVNKAFLLRIHGFLKKPSSLEGYKTILTAAMNYWEISAYPQV